MNRHIPRLCRRCTAPMARQQDHCWKCEATWVNTLPANWAVEEWLNEGGKAAPES